MTSFIVRASVTASLTLACGLVLASGADGDEKTLDAPIAATLEGLSEEVRAYNEHVVTLASPFMEGRVPGSDGMERAKDYMEYWFRDAGLTPAFPTRDTGPDGEEIVVPRSSWRDPFPLGGQSELISESLMYQRGGGRLKFEAGEHFTTSGLGGDGDVEGEIVFVGYSIDNGPDGFSSYNEDDDLTGKIAVMFRFEPMDEDGKSLWDGSPWSNRSPFTNKLRAVRERNAAGAIIINPPGADDPRVESLVGLGTGRGGVQFPVLSMSPEGGERLLESADPQGRSLMELRRYFDEGGKPVELSGTLAIETEVETENLIAENVGGMIPGRGALADEVVIVGAHLDHLGMGFFGSRAGAEDRGTRLHPGADDNASGCAALILMAQWMVETYEQMPEDADLRTIVYIAFDAEESGLNGSNHYVIDPIVPLEQHALMVNFDMIGRIQNNRLSVSGVDTAEGMNEWVEPIFSASPLEIVSSGGGGGGSDHLPFMMRGIPVLFAIIADFHDDYHTPEDLSFKLNRVGAVNTAKLFHEITLEAVQRPDKFVFKQPETRQRARGGMGNIKVRFGVMPGNYDQDVGVAIGGVTPGGSADLAGVQDGDILVRWDGRKITGGVEEWMGMLAEHDPGDKVQIGVKRDDEEITLDVELQSR